MHTFPGIVILSKCQKLIIFLLIGLKWQLCFSFPVNGPGAGLELSFLPRLLNICPVSQKRRGHQGYFGLRERRKRRRSGEGKKKKKAERKEEKRAEKKERRKGSGK